jgi:hypothetical protein
MDVCQCLLRREKHEVLNSQRTDLPYGSLALFSPGSSVPTRPNVLSIELSVCHVSYNMMIVKGTTTVRSVLKTYPLCTEFLTRFDRSMEAEAKSSGSVGSHTSKVSRKSADLAKARDSEAADARLRSGNPALWSLMEQFSALLDAPLVVRPCILLSVEIQNLLLLSEGWGNDGETKAQELHQVFIVNMLHGTSTL